MPSNFHATVTVDANQVLGEIDPKIFGQYLEFVEPHEHILYGGLCHEDGTSREDVVAALQEMGVPAIRLGGNYADVYRWQDGVGPAETRPRRVNYFWGGVESNRFGTDEFLALCEALHAQPYLNINLGSESMLEALGWLEYCNFPGGTRYSDLRRSNGREEPWAVPIWGIGNESWGAWEASYSTPEVYATRFNQYARYFKRLDPTVQLVAVGHTDPDWNERMLRHLDVRPDFLSVHMYGHSVLDDDVVTNFERLMAAPLQCDLALQAVEQTLAAWHESPVPLALDEWNVRHFRGGRLDRKSPRQVQDGLFVAAMFHMMCRHAASVKLASYVFMVNGHAPVRVTSGGIERSPLFDVFKTYQALLQAYVVPCTTDSPAFQVRAEDDRAGVPHGTNLSLKPPASLPCLDVIATRNASASKVTLAIINRSQHESVNLALTVTGLASAEVKAGVTSLAAHEPSALHFQDASAILSEDNHRTLEVAPLSITFLEFVTQP